MSISRIKTVRHGLYGTRPYNIWSGMKRRCYNKNEKTYARYGAKGIKMCTAWQIAFMNFWDDMRDTYFDYAQIDRIDNNRGYSKENCRWVTPKQQARNKSSVKLYNYEGAEMSIPELAEKYGIKKDTLYARIKNYGWSLEQALRIPVDFGNKYKRSDPLPYGKTKPKNL